jgi:hypothetical protein
MKKIFLTLFLLVATSILLTGYWVYFNVFETKSRLKLITLEDFNKECELASYENILFNDTFDYQNSNFYSRNTWVPNRQIMLSDGFFEEFEANKFNFYKFDDKDKKIYENIIYTNKYKSFIEDFYSVKKACARDNNDSELSIFEFLDKVMHMEKVAATNIITETTYKNKAKDRILELTNSLKQKTMELAVYQRLSLKSKKGTLPSITISKVAKVDTFFPRIDNTLEYIKELEKLEKKLNEEILSLKKESKNEYLK